MLENDTEKESTKNDSEPKSKPDHNLGVITSDILIPKAGPGEYGGSQGTKITVVYLDGRNPL